MFTLDNVPWNGTAGTKLDFWHWFCQEVTGKWKHKLKIENMVIVNSKMFNKTVNPRTWEEDHVPTD